MKDPHRYDDMLHLPHHQSTHHLPMSRMNRAAQFSPFAALTGYDQVIRETSRLTDAKVILDESARLELDKTLSELMASGGSASEVMVTFFEKDSRKEGGAYISEKGKVSKVDDLQRSITLQSGRTIAMDDILELKVL